MASGGRIRQEIYEAPYGLDAWDQRHPSRCSVSIVNTAQWMAITGKNPPDRPFIAKQFTGYRLPWFDYYDGDARCLEGERPSPKHDERCPAWPSVRKGVLARECER